MVVSKKNLAEDGSLAFSFHGQGKTLFGIHIVNLFFTIITLGIYHFWAKIKVRKYVWGQFEVKGDRFSYHGTPREIIIGWAKAIAFFGIPYLLLRSAPGWLGWSLWVQIAGGVLSGLVILVFIPVATVGSRRYRLSRTSWRGVRFSFKGKVKDYIKLFVRSMLLVMVTLGFYSPYWAVHRHRFLLRNSYLGDKKFGFDGEGDHLFKVYVIAVLLALPTLFFSLLWYGVRSSRYVWDHTKLGKARFRSTLTFWKVLSISFTNLLLILFTLGFGASWAEARYYRFMADNLFLDGDAELDDIAQNAKAAEATSDEIADFMDLDFDLG